jgi:hypothetical protein
VDLGHGVSRGPDARPDAHLEVGMTVERGVDELAQGLIDG